MSNISSVSLSGMQADRVRLDVAAYNVANIDTPDFYRQQALQQSVDQGQGGVRSSVTQSDTTGSALESDLTEQLAASYSFKANLGVILTEDHMMGTLIDLQA